MTHQARLARLHEATRRSRRRSLAAVLVSALLCGAMLWLSSDQRHALRHSLEALTALRTARADLAQGALEVTLAASRSAYDARQGLARIAQAADAVERAERATPELAGPPEGVADVRREVSALRERLRVDTTLTADSDTALMLAVSALDRRATAVDTAMREALTDASRRADQTFGIALAAALVLLVAMAAVIVVSERGLVAIFRDWRETDREIVAVFNSLPALIWFKGRDNRIRRANAQAAHVAGRTVEEIEGQPADEVIPAERGRSPLADREVLDGGVAQLGSLEQLPGETGALRWYRIDRVPYRGTDGSTDGLLVVARDVTELKATDDALLDERNRLAAIAAVAPTVMCSFRLAADGGISFPYASPKISEIYGLTPADLSVDASPAAAMWHPDDRPRVLASVEASRASMTPWHQEFRVQHPQRGEIWVEGDSVPFADPDGGITWHGAITDVTDRRRVLQDLEAREALLEETGAIAQIGGWEVDPLTGQGRWTAEVARIHDVDPALAPSVEFGLQFYPGEARERVRRAFEGALTGVPYDIEVPFVSATGAQKWVRTSGRPVTRDGHVVLVRGAIHDITERKRAEVAVQERLEIERRLSMLTAMSPAVMYTFRLDVDGRMTFPYASTRFEALFGVPAEVLAEDATPALARVHADDLPRVIASIQRSAEDGTPWVEEFRFTHQDGTAMWVEGRSMPNRHADGSTLWYGALLDVTDRHRLEAELRQAQKMEAIGRLAGGVAHDFNNLLTVILGNATQLLDDVPAQDEAREIIQASERAANLTKQLLLFSRKQVMQPQDLDLNAVLGEMTRMLQRILGEDIALRAGFAGGLPAVHADQGMMEQVLLNLAVNSRDAMPSGGELHVSTRLSPAGSADAHRPADLVDRDYVCLAVRDTGAGIPGEILPRIFEPFFTTKEPGKGTGLGLATVYGIVAQHDGGVAVESTVGEGTTFHVFLPAVASSARLAAEGDGPPAAVGNNAECVLIVEDEAAVREMAARVLRRAGYRVLTASSGAEALSAWAAHQDDVALLLTDMVMPGGMTGLALAQQIMADRPDLPVVLSSGYSRDLAAGAVASVPGVDFLEKPYRRDQLLTVVRRRLDAAERPSRATRAVAFDTRS